MFRNKITKIILIALLFIPSVLSAQQKRALVIGIGEQEDRVWGKINGDNDVILVNDILKRSNFSDITNLINRRATKSNIVKSFNSLIDRSKKGDIVYIHFSGHGQQMNDFNKDEKDNLDECWIPYDAYMNFCARDNGNRHLTDDEINSLLTKLKNKIGSTGHILVVADACHSGDSSRSIDGIVYRGTSSVFYASEDIFATHLTPVSEKWIILSACRDYQRNAELKTEKGQYGKLTYALYTILKNKESLSNAQLYRKLCDFFNRNRGALQQTPVMKGVTDKFKITDIF